MEGFQNRSEMNPGFGQLRLTDYFVMVYCIIRLIVWELPVFFLTYPYVYADTTSISFAANLQYFLVRTTNYLLNPASIRFLTRPVSEHINPILTSPRYSRYQENINHLVARPEFTGYWVLQHSLKSPKAPSSSDLTIFYLHGGGYFSSLPGHYLLWLLRLAESILEQGVSVSIFALDYSLAPEHVFPTQLEQAAAAYAYLTTEEQIPAGKIVLAGDSAGGHLALSLLVFLNQKRLSSVEDKTLGKPGGLVLMSPWLSLHHESTSFITNAHTDVLSGPFLRRTARDFLGHDPVARGSPKAFNVNLPYLEFLTPDPTVEWEAVIPSWIWVSAGEKEILFDNVKTWVGRLRGDLGDRRVVFDVGVRKVHVWQWLETMMDEPMKKAFLAREMGDGRGFEATANVGRAILARVKGD